MCILTYPGSQWKNDKASTIDERPIPRFGATKGTGGGGFPNGHQESQAEVERCRETAVQGKLSIISCLGGSMLSIADSISHIFLFHK